MNKTDKTITDEHIDELLSSLKADSPDFSKAIMKKINNERRFRTIRRIATASAAAVVIICAVPFVFENKADSAKSAEAPMMVYDVAEAKTEESCEEETIEETVEVFSVTEGTDDSIDLAEGSNSMAKKSVTVILPDETETLDVAECEPANGFAIEESLSKEPVPIAGNAEEYDEEIVYASESETKTEEQNIFIKFFKKIIDFYKDLFHIM